MKTPLLPTENHRPALSLHYLPDEMHYRHTDLLAWLPELKAMGVAWLVLNGSLRRAIPETFLTGLLQAGITPVIHIAELPLGQPLDLAALSLLAQSYAKWGVKHLVVFDQPNQPAGWAAEQFYRPNLIDRFIDQFLPVASTLLAAGLQPILPPLHQGGDYWDLAFLEGVLHGLQKRRQSALLAGLHLGCYAFCFDKPANWGAGGAQVWRDNRPYVTPNGSQDQLGWHSPSWYAEVSQTVLGRMLPIVMLNGGPDTQRRGAEWHKHCIEAILADLTALTAPTEIPLQNVCLGCLAHTEQPAQGWYLPNGHTLPAVAWLKHLNSTTRVAQPANPTSKIKPFAAAPSPNDKQLEHYLLMPTFCWGSSQWHWEVIGEFVRKFQPAVGFSLQEAALAKHVTILGGAQGISEYAEAQLRLAGCDVERIIANETGALQQELSRRIRTAQRFGSVMLNI